MAQLDKNQVIIAANAQRTSVSAAEKVYPQTGSLRCKVYEFIVRRDLYGATDQEIESCLKIDGNTVRPTRLSLVRDGFIFDTGTTRKNSNGNDCIVWRSATDQMLL